MSHSPLYPCPTCGLPAHITRRFRLGGSPHPVDHVKLVCTDGHWCTPPADRVEPYMTRAALTLGTVGQSALVG